MSVWQISKSVEYCAILVSDAGVARLDNFAFLTIVNSNLNPGLPLMKIPIDEIPESPKQIRFSESLDELNDTFKKGDIREFWFPPLLKVDLVCYRSGRDVFISGSFNDRFGSRCSRCLKDFSLPVAHEFDFTLSPKPQRSVAATEELQGAELGLSFYSGEEIDLAPLIREQVILSLPTRPLCREVCRGLCSGCGLDLNYEVCQCSCTADDPRMAFFRTLRIGR